MTKTVVIKCGGSILAELSEPFFTSIRDLQENGYSIVLVHGGGPEIGKLLNALNIKSEFVNGLRKTTSEVLEVVEMVLSGKVNKNLVTRIAQSGIKAVGLSGCDASLIRAEPIDLEAFGYVGEVTNVNLELLQQLLKDKYVPVISPIGFGDDFQRYNINADTAAAAVASELQAEQLLFVTDVPGIMKNGLLLPSLTVTSVRELMLDGTISGGMIPKVQAVLAALEAGLRVVTILNGRDFLLSSEGNLKGTKITREVV